MRNQYIMFWATWLVASDESVRSNMKQWFAAFLAMMSSLPDLSRPDQITMTAPDMGRISHDLWLHLIASNTSTILSELLQNLPKPRPDRFWAKRKLCQNLWSLATRLAHLSAPAQATKQERQHKASGTTEHLDAGVSMRSSRQKSAI